MLRLTAKATQFGHRTFTSWLIESAGTVPIKRKKDYVQGEDADNTEAMSKLMEVRSIIVINDLISPSDFSRPSNWEMLYVYFPKG